MVAAWSYRVLRGHSRVELDETQVTPCSDFRDHVPVRRYEVKRTAEWPPWAGPARGRTLAAGSSLSCASPGGSASGHLHRVDTVAQPGGPHSR